MNMGTKISITFNFWDGAAFYVAIKAYNNIVVEVILS